MEIKNIIHNTEKIYPKMITIKIYKEPLKTFSHEYKKPQPRDDFEPDESSIRRTRTLLQDYIVCNEFELFCTFTLDPKKFKKREDFNACYLRMQAWLHSQRTTHSPDLQYLVVPEKHKKGGYHFHALISHYNGLLSDSGHKKDGRPIFNISGWRFGFSTAVKINREEIGIVGRYVGKYITKDMSKEFGRKRYLASRNLKKPEKKHNSRIFRDTLPMGRKLLYDKDTYSVYEIDPVFFQRVKKRTERYIDLVKRQRIEEEKRLKFSST